jgi:hypothetical protein
MSRRASEFAGLSKAAYAAGDRGGVQDALREFGLDPDRYTVLDETGTDMLAVYCKDTNDIVVALRGTDIGNDTGNRIRDVSQWPAIGLSVQTRRIEEVKVQVEEIQRLRPGSSVYFTGHSLGGWMATELASGTGYKAVVFNPGMGMKDLPGFNLLRGTPENVLIYTTNDWSDGRYEPASGMSPFSRSQVVRIQPSLGASGLGLHDIDNFQGISESQQTPEFFAYSEAPQMNDEPASKRQKNNNTPTPAGSLRRMTKVSDSIPLRIQTLSLLMDSQYKGDLLLLNTGLKKLYGVESMNDLPYGTAELPFSRDALKRYFSGDGDPLLNWKGTVVDNAKTQHLMADFEDGVLTVPLNGNTTDLDEGLVRLVMANKHAEAAAYFEGMEQFQFLTGSVSEFFEIANLAEIRIVGHSLGGWKTRYLAEHLGKSWPNVEITGDVLNGHVTKGSISPDTSLPPNVTLTYHDIDGDISSFKNRSFEQFEGGNGADFKLYTPDKNKFTKDFLKARKPGELLKRVHRELVNRHDVDHFNDLIISKSAREGLRGTGAFEATEGPNGTPSARSQITAENTNYGRAALDGVASVGGGLVSGILGDVFARAFDDKLDDGIGGQLEHDAISTAGGTLVYGSGKAFGAAAKAFVGGRSVGAVLANGGLVADEFLIGAAEFGPAAGAGMLGQLATEHLLDWALKNINFRNPYGKAAFVDITSSAVGGAAAGAAAILAGSAAGPLGMVVGAGIGALVAGVSELVQLAHRKKAERHQIQKSTYASTYLGADLDTLGMSEILTKKKELDEYGAGAHNMVLNRRKAELTHLRDTLGAYKTDDPVMQNFQRDTLSQISNSLGDVTGWAVNNIFEKTHVPSSDDLTQMLSFFDKYQQFYTSKLTQLAMDGKAQHIRDPSVEDLKIVTHQTGHYGFEALTFILGTKLQAMKDRGVLDQFESGIWNNDAFSEASAHLDEYGDEFGVSRHDGETWSSFTQRVHEASSDLTPEQLQFHDNEVAADEFIKNNGLVPGMLETADDFGDRVEAAKTMETFRQQEMDGYDAYVRNTL